ncbi:hypothetical protein [Nesterenkonia jeotgali]|uniref:Uncharacterized protein n=1 Tax=Nesterenkonia jeotgali TaxID=317018 RepID=A0A839FM76_9MICC|nr:hypothetical protein [Nesterenkonia jeotgali]MBA8922770.1 hypothetical protein [Nesterenkonia jeotgali]
MLAGFPDTTLPAFTAVAFFGASFTAICGILMESTTTFLAFLAAGDSAWPG